MNRIPRVLTALGGAAALAFSVGSYGSQTKAGNVSAAEVRRAIEAGNATWPATSTRVVIGDMVLDGDLAYEWGHSEFHFAGKPGGPKARVGRYLAVWKRQSDGGWKLFRNLGLPERPN